MKKKPEKKELLNAEKLDLAFRAAEMRAKIDAILTEYGCRWVLGWDGKWVKLQAQFEDVPDMGVTLLMVAKGKSIRYMTEAEEPIK